MLCVRVSHLYYIDLVKSKNSTFPDEFPSFGPKSSSGTYFLDNALMLKGASRAMKYML